MDPSLCMSGISVLWQLSRQPPRLSSAQAAIKQRRGQAPSLKRGVSKRGILKCPVFHVLNFRGWIYLIYDKITLIYRVKNAFHPTSKVQNIENRVFQNTVSKRGQQLPLCSY